MRHLKKPTPAMVVACLSLFIALSGVTYAATGGNFILGQANTATTQTSLSSSNTAAPTLNLVNTGGRPAARFQANGGKAVFTVSNSTKIPNLNADQLDGKDAAALVGARAYASVHTCDGDPAFCEIRGKGVAYAVLIETGHYCVGVNGISAQDPNTIAVVTSEAFFLFARWEDGNNGCVASEFEVYTSGPSPGPATAPFSIVIP
jgi:hypothetical protein